MFKSLIESMQLDRDYPLRSRMIDAYTRVINNTLYDHLRYGFFDEYDSGNQVIPMSEKRPAFRYNLCRIAMDQLASLLFGSDHFPQLTGNSNTQNELLQKLVDECALQQKMQELVIDGSVGSAVVLVTVINQKIAVNVFSSQYFTPVFDPADGKTLLKLTEKYKIKGCSLNAIGYNVDDALTYWFMREWDSNVERYYKPKDISDDTAFEVDKEIQHGLGFVPAVWVKTPKKPGAHPLYDIDGECLFVKGIDGNILLEYQMSQAARALRYSSDPMVVFKLNNDTDFNSQLSMGGNGSPAFYRSPTKGIVLGQDDDATFLEITGKATEAVKEFVVMMREYILESLHGNRSHADKISAAQSGRAHREMNQPLIWLADKLRINFGKEGLLPLVELIIKIAEISPFMVGGKLFRGFKRDANLQLAWPDWYPMTPEENAQIANTLKTLKDSGTISRETAIRTIQKEYNIKSVEEEIQRIQQDQQELQELNPKVSEVIAA